MSCHVWKKKNNTKKPSCVTKPMKSLKILSSILGHWDIFFAATSQL